MVGGASIGYQNASGEGKNGLEGVPDPLIFVLDYHVDGKNGEVPFTADV